VNIQMNVTNRESLINEHKWIDLALQGDLDTFNQLILKHQDRVYSLAFWMLGDDQQAEDITQECFLRAFQKFRSFRGGSLISWLLRITANLCLDELRRKKRRPSISLDPIDEEDSTNEWLSWLADPSVSPEEAMENSELRQAIRAGIKRMKPTYRAALILVDLQQVDYIAAAAILRVPLGTLKSRLARGRLDLGKQLNSYRVSERLTQSLEFGYSW
jgi:RNA polymerase sigma-70 factor (ECF subfamily)